jgi:hypothetical protein
MPQASQREASYGNFNVMIHVFSSSEMEMGRSGSSVSDDTLILGDNEFVKQEDVELKRGNSHNQLLFNGCKLMIDGDEVALVQKEQGERLGLIDPTSK